MAAVGYSNNAQCCRIFVPYSPVPGWDCEIEAKILPGGNEFELTRFQQSLVFERGISNRSPQELRAIREACPGLAGVLNAAGFPFQPAGQDDPRCRQARR